MGKATTIRIVFSVSTAIVIEVLLALRWWHPYCDDPADGPGFWATGFPLPYAQPTGVSSGEFLLLVPIYLLNLIVIALSIFTVAVALRRVIPPAVQALSVALCAGGAAFVLLGTSLLAIPTFATEFSEGYDRLIDYRPAIMVDFSQHRACDR